MDHLPAVEGLKAPRDLLHDPAHALQIGLAPVGHPLGEGAALDVAHHRVEVAARGAASCALRTCGLSIRRAIHSSIMKWRR